MKIRYSVENIHCQKCADTILNLLSDEFGDIDVFLDKEPREISVNLESKEHEEAFKKEMDEIGFPIIEELERS
ncbi:MAG: heavy metal transport/detoxification protein [Campylobacteraceae bacterium]|jgi:copper chaperone CopZ|nr:heavy metal transport/detoxification protein [Campylobacteraceae bacterium]